MDSQDVLKTYAMFYVSENDEFNMKKKLDMLNFIENADESMLMDLFENGEIEPPFGLLDEVVEKNDATLIGESSIMIAKVNHLLEGDVILEIDLKNSLKDALGMQTDLKYKITKAAGSAKKALEKQLSAISDKIGDLKDSIAKGAGKAVEKGKEMAGEAGEAIEKGAKAVAKTAGKAYESGKEMAGEAGEKIAKTAGKAVEAGKEMAGEAGEKIGSAAGKAAEFAKDQPGMVGAAVAAAAALTAGVMAYRKFFSKAAQACKTAPDKAACLGQYKMKAKQAQIAALSAGKAKCRKSKNAAGCAAKIDAKINALKAKMRG
jgi:hypothetical protein